MGRLVDGVWEKGWSKPNAKGAFERPATKFRSRISRLPGAEHPAESGRYHLYVSHACPWAHRTMITRALRGLEDVISVTVVDPHMGEDGWPFAKDDPDPFGPSKFLRDVYLRADPRYTGQVTVPVLWDKTKRTIVVNESREVMRMLDLEMDAFATKGASLAPEHLRSRIDEVLDAIYTPINNGVYRAGFSSSQEAYEEAARTLFRELERWEKILGTQRFATGNRLTEADIALFTTLIRFDTVYYAHFKCNVHRIQDLPNLWGFTRDIYQIPEVRSVVHLDHIKTHYYWSQENVNPTRIVPLGPTIDFDLPTDRAARFGSQS